MTADRPETTPDADLVGYVATLINDCGTACETAEIAARLKRQIDYLAAANSAVLGSALLTEAYHLLRRAVATSAGIADDELHALDAAIMDFASEEPANGQ